MPPLARITPIIPHHISRIPHHESPCPLRSKSPDSLRQEPIMSAPPCRALFFSIALLAFGRHTLPVAAEAADHSGWAPLFNGTNLNGWYIVLRNSRSDDTNHLVQVENGAIHMYKDASAESAQPAGYIVTEKEYSNYHLRLEYK